MSNKSAHHPLFPKVAPTHTGGGRHRAWSGALWMHWCAACQLGWLIGWAVSAATGQSLAGLVVSGVATACCQWLVLRRNFELGGAWLIVTVPAWLVAFLAGGFCTLNIQDWLQQSSVEASAAGLAAGIAGYAMAGTIVGGTQYPLLRRRARHAAEWIIASACGLALGWALSRGLGAATGSTVGIYYGICLGYVAKRFSD
jgi:hypothetical protein